MNAAFYQKGLPFSCQRCSSCCRIDPGYVFLSEEDLSTLLKATGHTRNTFLKQYCRWVSIGEVQYLSLKEKEDYDCIFWEQGGCTIYPYRPIQCKSYPFWESFLESEDQWEALKEACPGVGKGEVHTAFEIQDWIHRRRKNPPIYRTFGQEVYSEG